MNDLFFVLPFLGMYCFWGHIDQIIPQLCRKRRTLKIEQELISNKHQCAAAALCSASCLDGCKRSVSLDYSSLGERGDLRDLCALDNSSVNCLRANSYLHWSHVERLGLRTLNCCVSSWFARL